MRVLFCWLKASDMDRRRELITNLMTTVGAVISLVAFMLPSLEIKSLSDRNSLYVVAIVSASFTGLYSIYALRRKERLRRRKRVFVIYSHRDEEVAVALVKRLRDAGFDPWFDHDEISPGERIEEALVNGLRSSAAAILLVSKNMDTASPWVALEIQMALSIMRGKSDKYSPVIPVRLDDHPIPKELSGISSIQLSNTAGFEKLERGLRMALEF